MWTSSRCLVQLFRLEEVLSVAFITMTPATRPIHLNTRHARVRIIVRRIVICLTGRRAPHLCHLECCAHERVRAVLIEQLPHEDVSSEATYEKVQCVGQIAALELLLKRQKLTASFYLLRWSAARDADIRRMASPSFLDLGSKLTHFCSTCP